MPDHIHQESPPDLLHHQFVFLHFQHSIALHHEWSVPGHIHWESHLLRHEWSMPDHIQNAMVVTNLRVLSELRRPVMNGEWCLAEKMIFLMNPSLIFSFQNKLDFFFKR